MIEDRALEGDQKALFYVEVFVYQVSKEIASHLAVLEGRVDAIILTGGIARSSLITEDIKKRVGSIAPIIIIAGEGEMDSLAENAYAVLNNEREIVEYTS